MPRFRPLAAERNFEIGSNMPVFVMHEHHASHHHFDFRLEIGGALASWAIPKGAPEAPGERRLAVNVEDHPIEYGTFEGTIPAGQYGAGTVKIWDAGKFELTGGSVDEGKLEFTLKGKRLKGPYVLVKMSPRPGRPSKGNEWLMIKR